MPWQCHDSSNRRPRLQAELRSSKETAETLEQSGEAAAVCCSMQWHSHFAQWRARVVEVMPFSFKLFKFHGLQLAPLSFNSSMLGSVKHCMSFLLGSCICSPWFISIAIYASFAHRTSPLHVLDPCQYGLEVWTYQYTVLQHSSKYAEERINFVCCVSLTLYRLLQLAPDRPPFFHLQSSRDVQGQNSDFDMFWTSSESFRVLPSPSESQDLTKIMEEARRDGLGWLGHLRLRFFPFLCFSVLFWIPWDSVCSGSVSILVYSRGWPCFVSGRMKGKFTWME